MPDFKRKMLCEDEMILVTMHCCVFNASDASRLSFLPTEDVTAIPQHPHVSKSLLTKLPQNPELLDSCTLQAS